MKEYKVSPLKFALIRSMINYEDYTSKGWQDKQTILKKKNPKTTRLFFKSQKANFSNNVKGLMKKHIVQERWFFYHYRNRLPSKRQYKLKAKAFSKILEIFLNKNKERIFFESDYFNDNKFGRKTAMEFLRYLYDALGEEAFGYEAYGEMWVEESQHGNIIYNEIADTTIKCLPKLYIQFSKNKKRFKKIYDGIQSDINKGINLCFEEGKKIDEEIIKKLKIRLNKTKSHKEKINFKERIKNIEEGMKRYKDKHERTFNVSLFLLSMLINEMFTLYNNDNNYPCSELYNSHMKGVKLFFSNFGGAYSMPFDQEGYTLDCPECKSHNRPNNKKCWKCGQILNENLKDILKSPIKQSEIKKK